MKARLAKKIRKYGSNRYKRGVRVPVYTSTQVDKARRKDKSYKRFEIVWTRYRDRFCSDLAIDWLRHRLAIALAHDGGVV